MERKVLTERGFSRAAAEDAKFTNLGLVGTTSNPVPKVVYTYDGSGNITQIDCYSGVANRVNINFPTVSLAGAYWLFENVAGSSKYYVWYYVDGSGSDPALAGRTGIQVTCSSSLASLTSATVTAVNASGAASFVYAKVLDTSNVSLYHKEYGAPVQPSSTSLGVTEIQQGVAFALASSTFLSYDANDNVTSQIRVEL